MCDVGGLSEKAIRNLFWYIFMASKGGPTRAMIVKELLKNPSNANKLAEKTGLDYTTVRHHLEILVSNGLLITQGEKYNVVYFPSEILEDHIHIFEDICQKLNSRSREKR